MARRSYDPTYGTRPLKRLIQREIPNPLAVELLKRDATPGCHVRVDYSGGDFTFERVGE
ncbi:MAG: hypothetical protein JW818_04655 [Pirellulales bacterium]|nr:hypothetical protein [Pirellulales bacterium]